MPAWMRQYVQPYTATYQGSNGNYRTETTPTLHFLTDGVPVPFLIWADS